MKNILKYLNFLFITLLIVSCNDGIDPITEVDPGADVTAPAVKIILPAEGTTIKVFEDETSFDVKFEVTDDIEVKTISILLDGNEIRSFNNFLDYRVAKEEFTQNGLVNGDHVLTVQATDIEGKTTSAEVNFSKQPPYSPLFDGEVLYMPFDGDYRD
ncbi:Ig-like domain-containing protein, partial [Algibacter sp.]|uniref:Ig-like domain-containing protein n=1 Tax=Algibacter sp. TaxID=1872428 RepID=UPI003C77043D